MPMCAHVDRRTIDKACEVGAVVEIETAKEVLVGLAAARMLRCDHAGYVLHQLSGAGDRHILEIGIADRALRTGLGNADGFEAAAIDDNLIGIALRIDTLRQGWCSHYWSTKQSCKSNSDATLHLPLSSLRCIFLPSGT